MRGIFIESLRGALVRLLRTFIMIVIILLIVFIIGLFHQEKVHALVYKQSLNGALSNQNFSGSLSSGENRVQIINFNDNFYKNGYDNLVIKFGKLSLKKVIQQATGTYTGQCSRIDSNGTCVQWGGGGSYTYPEEGNIYIQGALFYVNTGGSYKSTCYFSSELDNMLICPIEHSDLPIVAMEINIRNGGSYRLDYDIAVNSLRYYFNDDSTEVVKGLQGVTIEQQNTTQAIEDLTTQQEQAQQFIENNNVTSSQTQFQSGVSDLSQQINAQISGVNDLTQIVLLPVTLFMDLSTGTCTPLHLVVPFTNNEIDLPCMKPIYEQHFNGLLTIFSTVVCAVTTYWVSVNSAKLIKEILDCDNDRIEVIDL